MAETATTEYTRSADSARSFVRVMLAARLAVISFFMGVMAYYQVRHGATYVSSPALQPIAATYILSMIYAVLSSILKNQFRFAYIQLIIDAILIGWIIYSTGGISSPFSFMFILIIVGSAFLYTRFAPFILATLSTLIYCLLISFEYNGLINPFNTFIGPQTRNYSSVLVLGVVNSVGYYLVAVMSGYFTGLLREKDKQLIEQTEDFTSLQKFHEMVLSNMSLGFIAMGNDKKILSHNVAAEKMLGLPAIEIDNKDADEVLGIPEISEFVSSHVDRSGPSRQFEWIYSGKDRKDHALSMVVNKLTVSGVVNGAIGVLQDVTEHKKMQRQVESSERLAAIGRMAAGMAHEIRNPLASLSGSIQMMSADLQDLLDDKNVRLMDIITRETDRLNSIITQFLNYASGPGIEPVKSDISELMQETLILIKSNPEYSEKIKIESDIEKNLIAHVDPERIKQVIWNLCINAIDAVEHNDGKLIIKAQRENSLHETGVFKNYSINPIVEYPEYVRITVQDTGEGISKENLSKIFEPFFTTKPTGTGLGLPMVYKIVELHKGKISAKSVLGNGATFTVWLPVKGELVEQTKYAVGAS